MRLEITRKTDLATRALVNLVDSDRTPGSAEGGEHRALAAPARTKSSALAEAVGTTPGFLSQALTPLVTRGWVRSDPGPKGGYSLTADPKAITVLDIIEAIEGPTVTGRCVLESRDCDNAAKCALHIPWTSARSQMLTELQSTTLADLVTASSQGEAVA